MAWDLPEKTETGEMAEEAVAIVPVTTAAAAPERLPGNQESLLSSTILLLRR